MCEGEREGRRQQKVSEDELGKGEGRTRESSRRGTIASSSSKKMMQGDEARARAKHLPDCSFALSDVLQTKSVPTHRNTESGTHLVE